MGEGDNGATPSLDHDVETSDLDRDEREEAKRTRRAQHWWQRRRVDPDVRDDILGQLFFEGDRHRPYLYRFATLQALSIVVAVLGVLGGSPAIVIGAMLLAPLMTPVLALSAALVMVWPHRVLRSSLIVIGATAGSIGLAWLVAYLVPVANLASLPLELLSRTNPSLLDLVVALAAGAAGGYSLVREELGSALPGVAVAVALVPPLAVVGAALEMGRGDLASGAMLLYAVNLAGIVFAGGAVFLITGFIPAVRVARLTSRVVGTIGVALIAVAVVAVPLTRGLQEAVRIERTQSAVADEVETWLGDRRIEVVDISVESDTVTVDLLTEEAPPPALELGQLIEQRLGRTFDVVVLWTERHRDFAGMGGG
jgi:uncharacterized hydrophobic protein (TIGR00271 family)